MNNSQNSSRSDVREPIAFDLSPRFAENGEPLLGGWDAAEYAREEFLARNEVIAIMQGLQPRYRRGCPPYLDQHWSDVQRLLSDVRHHHLPMPCRPRELVRWADERDIELPELFVKYVPCPVPMCVVPPARSKPDKPIRKPPPIKASPSQQARLDTQDIATKIWAAKPTITIEKMLLEPLIAARTKHYTLQTARRWISEVDPRPQESKPGPRRKNRE